MIKGKGTLISILGGIMTGLTFGAVLYVSWTPDQEVLGILNVFACDAPYNVPPCTNLNLTVGLGEECNVPYGCYMPSGPANPDGTCMITPMMKTCGQGLVCADDPSTTSNTFACTDSCFPPQGASECDPNGITPSGDGEPCNTALPSCYSRQGSTAGTACMIIPQLTFCGPGFTCNVNNNSCESMNPPTVAPPPPPNCVCATPGGCNPMCDDGAGNSNCTMPSGQDCASLCGPPTDCSGCPANPMCPSSASSASPC